MHLKNEEKSIFYKKRHSHSILSKNYVAVFLRKEPFFNRNLGFSAVRMWYDIGTEKLMCVVHVCVSSLIDKI